LLWLSTVTVGISFLSLASCGFGAASSGTTSVASSGTLTPSYTSIDFGSVNVGSSASKSITITNSGTASIGITNLTVSGSYFSVSGLTAPSTLAPSQSVGLTIRFAPVASGVISGTLAISTDTPGRDLSITLVGTAISAGAAQLTATPSPVDFGSVSVGSTSSRTVTIANVGSATAYVSSASLSGPGFTITGLTTPLSLSAAQSTQFTVGFGPTSAGSASGNLAFKDGSGITLLNLAISGSAVAPSAHSVDLAWTASTSAVAGYRVYRGSVSGGPYVLLTSALVSATAYTDSTVIAGSTYFYVVTAVTSGNLESGFSNEVMATIPMP
jgi:hypothetical protein